MFTLFVMICVVFGCVCVLSYKYKYTYFALQKKIIQKKTNMRLMTVEECFRCSQAVCLFSFQLDRKLSRSHAHYSGKVARLARPFERSLVAHAFVAHRDGVVLSRREAVTLLCVCDTRRRSASDRRGLLARKVLRLVSSRVGVFVVLVLGSVEKKLQHVLAQKLFKKWNNLNVFTR